MTTLTAPTRKRPIDRHKAIRGRGTVLTVEQRIEHLADQLWDTVRLVRRLARLEARRARQTAWMDAHGHECPPDDYERRVAILAATEADWAAARIGFLEAAERCAIVYRGIDGQPWRQVREMWSVDFQDAGRDERAYRKQWAWWFEQFGAGAA